MFLSDILLTIRGQVGDKNRRKSITKKKFSQTLGFWSVHYSVNVSEETSIIRLDLGSLFIKCLAKLLRFAVLEMFSLI